MIAGSNELIGLAATQGIFAMLFVVMLLYTLYYNSKREERLMECINACMEGHQKQNEVLNRIETREERIIETITDLKAMVS